MGEVKQSEGARVHHCHARIKKDPEPEPGVSSPDGYSGGKGGAAQRYGQITQGPRHWFRTDPANDRNFARWRDLVFSAVKSMDYVGRRTSCCSPASGEGSGLRAEPR